MVRVTAPSSLEEGYTFDAVYNGEVFPVTVPRGGVKAGQVFVVPFQPAIEAIAVAVVEPPSYESTPMLQPSLSASPTRSATINIDPAPLGSWKTGCCDCFSEGCCHPSLLNAIFCPQVLMGQILTRMKLDWCGRPIGGYRWTTCTWIVLTLLYVGYRSSRGDCWGPSDTVWGTTLDNIFDDDDDIKKIVDIQDIKQRIHDAEDEARENGGCNDDERDTYQFLAIVWFWVTVPILATLRRKVRRAYGIPGSCCEDWFCSAFFECCTVSQLARQTANYTEQRAYFFTATGLAEGWYGDRQDELERRHTTGHHLVHAHSHDENERTMIV
jgi:Cys-rich protein (TIGR01571 family)